MAASLRSAFIGLFASLAFSLCFFFVRQHFHVSSFCAKKVARRGESTQSIFIIPCYKLVEALQLAGEQEVKNTQREH